MKNIARDVMLTLLIRITRISVIYAIVTTHFVPCCALPARDPGTGLVRVLYVGDPLAYTITPLTHLRVEPLFRMTAVPTAIWGPITADTIRRMMRLYMPRTYLDHLTRYDIVYISDADIRLFKPDLLSWFERGVVDGGQGLLMVGGFGSFGGRHGLSSWGPTSVGEVLPVECIPNAACEEKECVLDGIFPSPADPDHEFARPLPWDLAPPFSGMNAVETREGAVEIIVPKRRRHLGGPILAIWGIGWGSGMAHTPDLTPGWVGAFSQWEYFGDYVTNMIYLLAGLPVPQDVLLVHSARIAMANYALERVLLVSLSEFVERFGASTMKIEEGLAELDGMKDEVDDLYVKQDYTGALEGLDGILVRLKELGADAVRIKDRALLWMYLIEWLVVTGTGMVCGTVIWAIMVKRRLYREATITKLVPRTDS